MRRPLLLLVLVATLAPPAGGQAVTNLPPAPASAEHAGWIYFDAPLWDISNEGLPFRFTVMLPSERDVLTRLLLANEARWTLSVGYAKGYDSYDATTGVFKNPGGHAALFSAGRQMRWDLPRFAGQFTPRLALELGAHLATRRFPSDGTRANVKAIAGLEWIWRAPRPATEWSAGIMWLHFSNGNIDSRNAGYDALMLRMGRSVRF